MFAFEELLFDPFAEFLRGQPGSSDFAYGLKRDHSIRRNDDVFIQLRIQYELDFYLIERVELEAARRHVSIRSERATEVDRRVPVGNSYKPRRTLRPGRSPAIPVEDLVRA